LSNDLRSLSERYARGVDRRDPAMFVGVFHADGVLEVYHPRHTDVLARQMQGREELGRVTELIKRYERTFHLLGQSSYDVDGDSAVGEVYCVAHHISSIDGEDTDRVMYIRYEDEYRYRDGRWGIQRRRLRNEWEELRAVVPSTGIQQ
jgi:SnoaL-like domain